MTRSFRGPHFFVRERGRFLATPLLLVLLVVEGTDIIFALDSIPAIFAVTTHPFIIFTSNVFAILGLRALYFVLANVLSRLAYLKTGLALVLAFVGVKMLISKFFPIPIWVSLIVIAGILTATIVISLLWPPRGTLPSSHPDEPLRETS
jgi:tellurite resistance protein TerC